MQWQKCYKICEEKIDDKDIICLCIPNRVQTVKPVYLVYINIVCRVNVFLHNLILFVTTQFIVRTDIDYEEWSLQGGLQ